MARPIWSNGLKWALWMKKTLWTSSISLWMSLSGFSFALIVVDVSYSVSTGILRGIQSHIGLLYQFTDAFDARECRTSDARGYFSVRPTVVIDRLSKSFGSDE